MREAERLDSFYEQLKHIHKKYFCDWRFGQFMLNFTFWLKKTHGIDGFYLEEDKMLEYIGEYAVAEGKRYSLK